MSNKVVLYKVSHSQVTGANFRLLNVLQVGLCSRPHSRMFPVGALRGERDTSDPRDSRARPIVHHRGIHIKLMPKVLVAMSDGVVLSCDSEKFLVRTFSPVGERMGKYD
jgi:hypothetical protein